MYVAGSISCNSRRLLTFPNSTSCEHFAIVKWLQTLLIVIPAETVLLIRYAVMRFDFSYFFPDFFADRTSTLTSHNRPIMLFLVSLMIFQCFVVFYAMSNRSKNQGSIYITA